MECAAAIDILRVKGHVTLTDARRAKHKLTRVVQNVGGVEKEVITRVLLPWVAELTLFGRIAPSGGHCEG